MFNVEKYLKAVVCIIISRIERCRYVLYDADLWWSDCTPLDSMIYQKICLRNLRQKTSIDLAKSRIEWTAKIAFHR